MDASAIALMRDNKMPLIVFSLDEPGGFKGILNLSILEEARPVLSDANSPFIDESAPFIRLCKSSVSIKISSDIRSNIPCSQIF